MIKHSEYELVPKKTLSSLKEENERLKNEIDDIKKEFSKIKTIDIFKKEILEEFKVETRREREIVSNNLEYIKDLSQKTINEVVSNSTSFESQVEQIVSNLKVFIETIEKKKVEEGQHQKEEIRNMLDKFFKDLTVTTQAQTTALKTNNSNYLNTEKNINELKIFLEKLRKLLSYIGPNDLKVKDNNS